MISHPFAAGSSSVKAGSTTMLMRPIPQGGASWTLLLDMPLQPNETPQEFDLVASPGSPVVVERIKFSITGGIAADYWDLGEVEAWGQLL